MASLPTHATHSGSFLPNSRPGAIQPQSALSKKLAQISEREGEDAVLTGGTRSLSRRLLALNITEIRNQTHAVPGTRQPLSRN